MRDLAALIERLEKATGPDVNLDEEIYWFLCERAERAGDVPFLSFTKSIDAALMLVPEGMFWIIGSGKTREHEPLGSAEIFLPSLTDYKTIGEAEHDSPIIALCIAAMKAKAASIESKT